jgi:hypothetical protein
MVLLCEATLTGMDGQVEIMMILEEEKGEPPRHTKEEEKEEHTNAFFRVLVAVILESCTRCVIRVGFMRIIAFKYVGIGVPAAVVFLSARQAKLRQRRSQLDKRCRYAYIGVMVCVTFLGFMALSGNSLYTSVLGCSDSGDSLNWDTSHQPITDFFTAKMRLYLAVSCITDTMSGVVRITTCTGSPACHNPECHGQAEGPECHGQESLAGSFEVVNPASMSQVQV